MIGAISIAVGFWFFDSREREAQDIRNFAFFFPSVEDVKGFVTDQEIDSDGRAHRIAYGMRFKNSGSLPLEYRGRTLALASWDGKTVSILPAVNKGKIQAALLGVGKGTRVATVGPGSFAQISLSIDLGWLDESSSACLYYAAVFQPILTRAGKELLEEHSSKDYAHAISQTVYHSNGKLAENASSEEEAAWRDKIEAGTNACINSFKDAIQSTYMEMLMLDSVAADDYRNIVTLSHSAIFEEIDSD